MTLDRCPSTLKKGFQSFSPSALRSLFNNRRVDHVLPFNQGNSEERLNEILLESFKRFSIGGRQKKVSLSLLKNKLAVTQDGDEGQYILKLHPGTINHADEAAANEHVTMQLASQVFGIRTAKNSVIFFQNGQRAYLTKRFDYLENGLKAGTENFSSLSHDATQANYQHVAKMSEQLFALLQEYVGPYRIEGEQLFKRILFNQVVSNTEDDIKNYSLIETRSGDYILSPAYDLICSSLHGDGSKFSGNATAYPELLNIGLGAGLPKTTIINVCRSTVNSSQAVESLIRRSFLSPASQDKYLTLFQENLALLSRSFKGW
jgi:serine/threonine-protein kinase HipA